MKQMIRELGMVILLGGFGGFIRTLVGKKRGEPYTGCAANMYSPTTCVPLQSRWPDIRRAASWRFWMRR